MLFIRRKYRFATFAHNTITWLDMAKLQCFKVS